MSAHTSFFKVFSAAEQSVYRSGALSKSLWETVHCISCNGVPCLDANLQVQAGQGHGGRIRQLPTCSCEQVFSRPRPCHYPPMACTTPKKKLKNGLKNRKRGVGGGRHSLGALATGRLWGWVFASQRAGRRQRSCMTTLMAVQSLRMTQ